MNICLGCKIPFSEYSRSGYHFECRPCRKCNKSAAKSTSLDEFGYHPNCNPAFYMDII